MRFLLFTLSFLIAAPFNIANANEERTADYTHSIKPEKPHVQAHGNAAQGNLEVTTRSTSKPANDPVDSTGKKYSYGSADELNAASEAAVLDGKLYTTQPSEKRRDTVPRIQELGF